MLEGTEYKFPISAENEVTLQFKCTPTQAEIGNLITLLGSVREAQKTITPCIPKSQSEILAERQDERKKKNG